MWLNWSSIFFLSSVRDFVFFFSFSHSSPSYRVFVNFSENICDSLSCVDGFAFFVFDFWDEDSLFPRLDTGDILCPCEFFSDLLYFFLSCRPFFSDVFFDFFADFTDSLFFMLLSHLPFLYEGQDLFVFIFCFLCF